MRTHAAAAALVLTHTLYGVVHLNRTMHVMLVRVRSSELRKRHRGGADVRRSPTSRKLATEAHLRLRRSLT